MLPRATIQPTQTTGARSASTLTVPIEDERASPGQAKFGFSSPPESGRQDDRGWPDPARESRHWRVPATDQLGQPSTSSPAPARWVLEADGTDRDSRKYQLRRQEGWTTNTCIIGSSDSSLGRRPRESLGSLDAADRGQVVKEFDRSNCIRRSVCAPRSELFHGVNMIFRFAHRTEGVRLLVEGIGGSVATRRDAERTLKLGSPL